MYRLEQNSSKFSKGSSIWDKCSPEIAGNRKMGNSNMQEFFAPLGKAPERIYLSLLSTHVKSVQIPSHSNRRGHSVITIP